MVLVGQGRSDEQDERAAPVTVVTARAGRRPVGTEVYQVLKAASDQRSVHSYVEAVRSALDRDELREALEGAGRQIPGAGTALEKLHGALPSPGPGNQSSGGSGRAVVPYLSRSAAVSLVQSALEEALLEREGAPGRPGCALWVRVRRLVDGLLDPGTFSPSDPDWVVKIALATLGHLAQGNHPFNPRPAGRTISDTARLVVVGDWGTGLPRAQAVARLMAGEVAAGLSDGRDVHVIHLGDVYYSGLPGENRRHVLDHWPVTRDQAAAGVTSWSLNGNHDMYSGGFGYFQTLLGDERFTGQRSADAQTTSFFRLTSPSWDFVGLDTSWNSDLLSTGAVAVLQEPQGAFVASVAAQSPRKLVLFSHHQLVSVYDQTDIGPELTTKLRPVLDSNRVTAWWWGHEHRNMAFRPTQGVRFPRCVGHGGVPVLQPRTADDPVPAPGLWEDRSYLLEGGQRWARFGYAALDLDGDRMSARYVDETGDVVRREVIE